MLLLLPSLLLAITVVLADKKYDGTKSKGPVLLIPGFASTQLHAWTQQVCVGAFGDTLYRDIDIGDRIWIDTGRVIAHKACWLECMRLHMLNQSDTTCRLRPAEGLASISELDPGVVTGPLSHIWGSLIQELVEDFDLNSNELAVASYDWRLPPSVMQQRDFFFYKLQKKIEEMKFVNKERITIVAHSMGNFVFRYFMAWLQQKKESSEAWIDEHIEAYVAVAPSLLGGTEAILVLMSGVTNGLPLPVDDSRKVEASFGSVLSILPFPANNSDENKVVVNFEYENGLVKNYTLRDIQSGLLFTDLVNNTTDYLVKNISLMRERYYINDSVLNPFTTWSRPPVDNVFVMYGTGTAAKSKFSFKERRDSNVVNGWESKEVMVEEGDEYHCNKTGDGTVSYYSLSWAHSWLGSHGSRVNVSSIPSSVYYEDDAVETEILIRNDKLFGNNIMHAVYTNSSSNNKIRCREKTVADRVIYYEHQSTRTSTVVVEFEGVKHREILANLVFHRELSVILETIFSKKRTGVNKTMRPPTEDVECYWNYRRAHCHYSDYCEYNYHFGDVTLDQSCRIKNVGYGETLSSLENDGTEMLLPPPSTTSSSREEGQLKYICQVCPNAVGMSKNVYWNTYDAKC